MQSAVQGTGLTLVNRRDAWSALARLVRQIRLKLISTRVHICPHAYTRSAVFRKCWHLRVRMRELTLDGGTRGQVKKTFLSCRVLPQNGRLRTWVTEIINLIVLFGSFRGNYLCFYFFTMCGVLLCHLKIFIFQNTASVVYMSFTYLAREPFLECLQCVSLCVLGRGYICETVCVCDISCGLRC